MNQIEIINETKEEIKELEVLPDLLEFAANKQQVKDVVFNIIIVDNEYIHQLNKTYRGVDRPTDVISFALEDNGACETEFGRILGDIYISIDQARIQAKEYGHSLKRELAFLSIHGFLHLLGYDHMTEEEEKEMFGRQEWILNEYGIKREK
ncbi:MAG TPA: rRNA maturation RNase YbeY [Candidatus Pelethosoma merdigallinarum]|nr:rRNA maturation RNase YbeY [Candidatus Pelethosoma merdigallinarum]